MGEPITAAARNGPRSSVVSIAVSPAISAASVAKAYREMEHAGLIVLRHGAGAFVAENKGGSRPEMQKGRAVMHRAVSSLRDLGLDEGAIRRLLESELSNTGREGRKK